MDSVAMRRSRLLASASSHQPAQARIGEEILPTQAGGGRLRLPRWRGLGTGCAGLVGGAGRPLLGHRRIGPLVGGFERAGGQRQREQGN